MFKNISFRQIIYYLLLLFLFLLPWQTRYIFAPAFLNGGFWEYGAGSFYATEILLWLIIVLSFIDILRNRGHWQSRKMYLFVTLLAVGYALLAVATSLSSSISFNWMFHLLEGACLAIIILNYSEQNKKLLLALWLSGVAQGLLAIWQFFSQSVIANKWLGMAFQSAAQFGSGVVETGGERWLRAYGTLGGPNPLGAYLAVMWILGFIIFLQTPTKKIYKYIFTIGQLIILSGLILSFSRGAWIAAGAGIVAVVILNVNKMVLLKQLIYSFLLILFFLVTLAPLFSARVNSVGRLETKSIDTRVTQYQDAVSIIESNHSILFGIGPGTYTWALSKLHPGLHGGAYQPIHNVYLLALAEIGIVGCFLVFLLFCFLVRWLWKHNRIFLAVIFTLLITALFEHFWWSLYVGMVGWGAVIGVGVAGLDSGVDDGKIN